MRCVFKLSTARTFSSLDGTGHFVDDMIAFARKTRRACFSKRTEETLRRAETGRH